MGHDDAVSQMCWSGERLYTASWDSTVKVGAAEWQVSRGSGCYGDASLMYRSGTVLPLTPPVTKDPSSSYWLNWNTTLG